MLTRVHCFASQQKFRLFHYLFPNFEIDTIYPIKCNCARFGNFALEVFSKMCISYIVKMFLLFVF